MNLLGRLTCVCLCLSARSLAFSSEPPRRPSNQNADAAATVIAADGCSIVDRRAWLGNVFLASSTTSTLLLPSSSNASGGATAGKYTTIPIAKRRYYGRVQQAVHDFLAMGPDIVKGDMSSSSIQTFFDTTATVIIEAKRKDVNGQCTKRDGNCKGEEVRDSRYNDMKTSMYLLGNAFRINQTKAPENLPTVKAAKKFFKEMDAMERNVIKKKGSTTDSQQHYLAALDILDEYLDLVELPPTDSGHYDQEFSTLVGDAARIT